MPIPRASCLLFLGVTLAVAAGCAPKGPVQLAADYENIQDYDRAVAEYTRALQANPDDRDARQGLERAKIRASLDHYTRGRRLAETGRLEEASLELQLALELNPTNTDIEQLLGAVRVQLRNKVQVARDGKTQLETLIERARTLPAPGPGLPEVQMPGTLSWNDGARDLLLVIGKLANISVVFDPQFRDQPLNVDLRNQSLTDALRVVTSATRTFYRVTAPRTVTVAPDTPAKRQEYEEEIVKVFPLSNADVKEVSDLLRIVIDARRLSTTSANNTIAVKDSPARVEAAGRLISAIDKARPEVVIDVEILEVDRTRLREYGLQIASPGEPPTGLNGAITINQGNDVTLQDLRNLSASDIYFTRLPGLFYRLLKTDTNTRTLANTQIRLSDGQAGQASFGEEVPVPVTVFSPIATGGVNQQPITSFNYRNVGVNIDVTPRTHHDADVSLALKLEISSISGTGFGGLPTFGSRSVATTNRLHDGETNLLAGLIRDEDRRAKSGVPGLVDIPGIGSMFAYNTQTTHQTDVVITLTPRIIRVLDVTEADLQAFEAGSALPGVNINLPLPGVNQNEPIFTPPPQTLPQPAVPPATAPGPIGPIFPPQPQQPTPPPQVPGVPTDR